MVIAFARETLSKPEFALIVVKFAVTKPNTEPQQAHDLQQRYCGCGVKLMAERPGQQGLLGLLSKQC